MKYPSLDALEEDLKGILEEKDGKITILDEEHLRGEILDRLIFNGVFNDNQSIIERARWLIKAAAYEYGIKPASIQTLYEAMGRKEIGGFTVPAINIRGMSYDVARAVIRAALKNQTGAFIFEIARSEIGYTDQSPDEYGTAMLAAALKEGYKGPLFLQGDHFQAKARIYKESPQKEMNALKNLIKDAIGAGFYNIDIDTSTLVDLSKPDLKEQQRLNYEIAAEFTAYIRQLEPEGYTISVGGEIGEVGGKNSTVEDLRAFMEGYKEALAGKGSSLKGISKISVQTGTTHGGVVLPDGTIAKVKIDFDTLERISKVARDEYGLAGPVQHGASTLPDEAFHRFPETGTAEIHLATGFQNMIYDSPLFPSDLRSEIYNYIKEKFANEKKPSDSEEQFIYKTRKKAFGPFKERFWTLSEDIRKGIGNELEKKFDFLFNKLNVKDTKDIVLEYVKPCELYPAK